MKTAAAALNAIDAITRGSLAFAHPYTRAADAAMMSSSDETSSPVIDIR